MLKLVQTTGGAADELLLMARAERIDPHAFKVPVQTSFMLDMLEVEPASAGKQGTLQWKNKTIFYVLIRTLSRRKMLPAEFCASMRRCFPDKVHNFNTSLVAHLFVCHP